MNETSNNPSSSLRSSAETRRIYSAVFEQKEAPCPRTLLITSGSRGEGKTTLACNLASLAAREKGKKVLVIDYNWFSPGVHTQFGISEQPEKAPEGASTNPLDKVTQVPEMENLSVLTAEAFSKIKSWQGACSSSDLSKLMSDAKERYDQVFIDASAVYPTNRNMNDPMFLGKEADGVILVALTNVTPKSKTKRASCALQSNGAKVIGIVANQWKNPLST